MAHVNREVLRFIVAQVDWTAIMHELVETQPETVAELLNNHFSPKDNKPSQIGLRADFAMGLDRAFTYACRAVNTSRDGHMTTTDKINAIKELRNAFGMTLKDAKYAVEQMMDRYSQDPCYYPHAISGSLGYTFE